MSSSCAKENQTVCNKDHKIKPCRYFPFFHLHMFTNSICEVADENVSTRLPFDFSRQSLQLDLSTIKEATINFSDDNKLGQGGFGPVYKGTLPDGHEVAVKRLSTNP